MVSRFVQSVSRPQKRSLQNQARADVIAAIARKHEKPLPEAISPAPTSSQKERTTAITSKNLTVGCLIKLRTERRYRKIIKIDEESYLWLEGLKERVSPIYVTRFSRQST